MAMDAKDLRIESTLGEHSHDGSSKYARSVAALPCSNNKTYEAMASNPLAKVETQTSRPCAVIGPDRILPQPSVPDTYLKKSHYEPWPPMDSTYRQPPEYPYKMPNYLTPLGNISPRQTFQENMPRIMVQPTYNTKVNDDSSYALDRSLSKSNKVNGASDPKYCDVPYTVNQINTDQKNTEMCVPNVNNARSYPQMWHPASVNMRPARPYGAPDPYQYPEYTCASTRPVQMTRPHRTMNEDPGHVYNDTYYQESNIRFKPYPNIKERYPQSRYDYANNYANPFHPPHPYPPYKYDIQKGFPPHVAHSQVPIKYVDNRMSDSSLDGYQRPQQVPYPTPYRNQVIHPAYGPMLSSNLGNKVYSYPPEAPVKSIATNKLPYDNKLYLDYEAARNKGYPMSDSFYDMRPMKSQVIIPNYPTANMQPIHPHSYYRKENLTTKNYEYISHLRHLDPMSNPALSKLSSQFSPNSIAISPSDSNTSNDTTQTQGALLEDCGYVSQSSTASMRSVDSSINRIMPNDFHRRYNYAYPTTVRTSPLTSKPDVNSHTSDKNKKGIDVRQFLQMWNEGEEENGGNAKDTQSQPDYSNPTKPTSHYKVAKNHDQLYVLGLTNVPSEELGKYEHIQKVSKLPENIKGYNNIELLKHFEEAIESSNLSNLNQRQSISRHYQMTTKQSLMQALPPRPLSPLDVEAKISQSVIHKEVGCNFEIKPCSPEMLNVEAATAAQKITNERTIEKIANPLVIKPPMKPPVSSVNENQNIRKLIKQNDPDRILNENNKIPSCNMLNTQCSNDVTSVVKANYTLHDLESNASVCLASLPRLDNDIELNFPEVNQQFINANKESVITNTDLNSKPNNVDESREDSEKKSQVVIASESEKEFSKLSKYRKVKKVESVSKEIDIQMNFQSLRTDSVIIKNPENTKVMEYNAENQSNDMKRIDELQDLIVGPTSGCETYENTNRVQDLTNETAIDFSLNKINVDELSEKNTAKPNEKLHINKKPKKIHGKKRKYKDKHCNYKEKMFSNTNKLPKLNSGENKITEKNEKQKCIPHNSSLSISPGENQLEEKNKNRTSTIHTAEKFEFLQVPLCEKEDSKRNINSSTTDDLRKHEKLATNYYEDSSDTLSANSDENEIISKNEIHTDPQTSNENKSNDASSILPDSVQNINPEFDIQNDENRFKICTDVEKENLAIRNSNLAIKGNEENKINHNTTSSHEFVSLNSVMQTTCTSLIVERDAENNNNIDTNLQSGNLNILNEYDSLQYNSNREAINKDSMINSQNTEIDFSNSFISCNVAQNEGSNIKSNVSSLETQTKHKENNNLGTELQVAENTYSNGDLVDTESISKILPKKSFDIPRDSTVNNKISTESKNEECKDSTSVDICEYKASQAKNNSQVLMEVVSSKLDDNESLVVNSFIERHEVSKSCKSQVSGDMLPSFEPAVHTTNDINFSSMNSSDNCKEKLCESEREKNKILESDDVAAVKCDSALINAGKLKENDINTKLQNEKNENSTFSDYCHDTDVSDNVENLSVQPISCHSMNVAKDSEENFDPFRECLIQESFNNTRNDTAQNENDNSHTQTHGLKSTKDKEENKHNPAHSSNCLNTILKPFSLTGDLSLSDYDVKSTDKLSLDKEENPVIEKYDTKSVSHHREDVNLLTNDLYASKVTNDTTSISQDIDKNLTLENTTNTFNLIAQNSDINYFKLVDNMVEAIAETESDVTTPSNIKLEPHIKIPDNGIVDTTELYVNGDTPKEVICENSTRCVLNSSNNTSVVNKITMGKKIFSPWIQKLFFKNEGKCVNDFCTGMKNEGSRHYFNLLETNEDTSLHLDISDDRILQYVSENDDNMIDDLIIEQTSVLSTNVELSQIHNNLLSDIDMTNSNPDEINELFEDISNNDDSIADASGIYGIGSEINTTEKSFDDNECNVMLHIPSNIDCDEDSIEKSLNLIHAENTPDIVQPIAAPTFPRICLKRSLSDSALNEYNNDSQDSFPQKTKKYRKNKALFNVFNIQNNRRNSISSINNEESMSFCIVIDNNCIIAEEIEEEENICYNISDQCLQTIDGDSLNEDVIETTEEIILCPQDDTASYVEPLVLEMSDVKSLEESWVEDVACVETVVSDDIAEDVIISAPSSPRDMDESENEESDIFNDTEHTEKVKYIYGDKMCNDDAELVETLYRTPQMDVNKTLTYREPYLNENSDQEEDQNIISDLHDLATNNTEQTENSVTIDTAEDPKINSHASEDFKTLSSITEPSISDIRKTTCTNRSHENTQNNNINYSCELSGDLFSSKTNENSKNCSFSSPEVSSTTTEEKNSAILLKITNFQGTRISHINDIKSNRSNSCRFTENVNYTSYHSNSTEPRPLMTKAAQKYIPPSKDVVDDLKVKLPLPRHSLMKFKQLKFSRNERSSTSVTNNNFQKKPKPKFEDVLKSIDEMQYKRHKEKGKKPKKSIPKVVIKKNENGSHYASTPVEESFDPDLTGRKWQPWVFMEKNMFIDKMAIRKKTKAIYNHRKNTYVLAEKFRKYKSIQSAKFIISQPNTDNSSAGQFKYTIRLKHSY